jgi:AcrR family transcriptional regulator
MGVYIISICYFFNYFSTSGSNHKGHGLQQKDRQKADKRKRIIEAAARVFADRGFTGTAMADIAIEAGVGKGTLYEYFIGKESLFFAVFEWFARQSGATAMTRVSALGGSAGDRLEAMSEALMDSWSELKDIFSLSMEFWAASGGASARRREFKEAFRNIYTEFRGIVSSLIREGVKTGEFSKNADPDGVAAALVGAWDALFLQAWFDPGFEPNRIAPEFMKVLIAGLKSV